jgi:hypothetical protein
MAWLLSLVIVFSAHGQRNALWSNPGLSARGVQPGEQQLMLRQDMSACHGAAFEASRAMDDEQKRKHLGIAVFNRCMAEKGWQVRQPRKPEPKAPREISS